MAEPKTQPVTKHAAQAASRQDPVRRSLDGVSNELIGARADRKYIYVYTNAADGTGVPFYEELGYSVEHHGEGSPRMVGVKKQPSGQPIMFRGHVLMSIPLEEAERIAREGAPMAGTGTAHWDRLEKQLVDKRFDPIGNMPGRQHMHLINQNQVSTEMGL